MKKTVSENLPFFQFHFLQKFSETVEHGIFSRLGGVSLKSYESLNVRFGIGDTPEHVVQNRAKICEALKIESNQLISANQTHGKNIAVIDEEYRQFRPTENSENRYHDDFDDVDGFVTALPEMALMIQVADCQAIVMLDPVKKAIAMVHAGWKGLVQDISGEAIKIMQENFGAKPENILVGIAPSLGACCAFFSDPEKELPANFRPFIKYNKCVDLWGFSIQQLELHGILPQHIELSRVCTFCGGGEKFFSFRRDRGITGRFGVVVMLRSQ